MIIHRVRYDTAMPRRILIAQFAHETNTFSRLPTTLEDYRRRWLLEGDAIAPRFRGTRTEFGGLLDYADRAGWELVPAVAANATPSGKLTREAWEAIRDMILAQARKAGRVDGAVLALHGAMVSETEDDAEGALLEALRGVLGPELPIAVTLDLHANATPRMSKHANALISYRTYPHVDQYERAQQAAALVDLALDGGARPRNVIVQPPTLNGADHGRTVHAGPMRDLLALAERFEQEDGIHVVSIQAGFMPADIEWTGPSVAVTHEPGMAIRARAIADELSREIWRRRDEETVSFRSIAEVMAAVRADDGKAGPLVIADGTDNPGGGGYGDATNMLRALIDGGAKDAAVGHIYDPAAVQAARRAGTGNRVRVSLGGHIDPRFGEPIKVDAHVQALSNGSFINDGPMGKGTRSEMGPSAVLRIGGVEVITISNRLQNTDLQTFLSQGIDPAKRRVVMVKSVHHFRAAYAPIAREVMVVDSGALCTPDPRRHTYTKLRRPIWPLDIDTGY
jgi:microcystin degradation protein MlrC